MKKIALFLCSFDGIATKHSGVGTATFGYLSSIKDLRTKLQKHGLELECHAITNKYSSDVLGYDSELLTKATKICKDTGGNVHFCLNDSIGDVHFGNERNWNCVSASAATIASNIVENGQFDLAILIGIDTPYAFAPIYFSKQTRTETKLVGIFTPHSTSLIHERGSFNLSRIKWEQECISEINKTENLFVSYLNQYMYKHLNLDYGVASRALIPLLNGVNFDEIKIWSQKEIEDELTKWGIPTDKPLIFTYGRGAWYKGFDLFLEAAKKLGIPAHFVVQVAPYSPHERIEERIKEAAVGLNNKTLIFQWSFDLPRKIMQWKNTVLTAVLSRYEPGAFIPAEIRVYGNSVCLISDRDGLPCQVTDGQDGYICNIDSIDDIVTKMENIFNLDEKKKVEIKKNGKDLVYGEYDIQKNFNSGIMSLISKYIPS